MREAARRADACPKLGPNKVLISQNIPLTPNQPRDRRAFQFLPTGTGGLLMVRLLMRCSAILVGLVGIGGCMPVAAPTIGVLYTDVKYGDTATTSTSATKEGKACAQTILAMVATGDASIAAAKANGGITEVSFVDHTANSILGIVGEWCTIVKGK
jgi:hypothetical protein